MLKSEQEGHDMKLVVAVDWSDQDFAALHQAVQLYRPTEVTLVHAVDMGLYFEQEAAVDHESDRGTQLLERAAKMVPSAIKMVRRINETASPAELILDSANKVGADLIVVGTRGRSRLAEAFLGSTSSRVLLHNARSTLIVKGGAREVRRVLVAIEGLDDGDRVAQWLMKHPFTDPVEICVFNAVVPIEVKKAPHDAKGTTALQEGAKRKAEDIVKATAGKLTNPQYKVSTKVAVGKPSPMIQEQAKDVDLVVTSSHGRKGISRFLVGSVSYAVVHDVSCPVLVVR
jgi:nucleotide-binding universal stress UspA family protein